MKPPYCHICGVRINDFEHAGVINFAKTQYDIEWEIEMKREHKVGHPPYAEWFCEEHYPTANQYSHLCYADAMREIKKTYPDSKDL
jgi:hypothetical protein